MTTTCTRCGSTYDSDREDHIAIEKPAAVSCIKVEKDRVAQENLNANSRRS